MSKLSMSPLGEIAPIASKPKKQMQRFSSVKWAED